MLYPIVFSILAALMIAGWMMWMLRIQKRHGYNPNGPDFDVSTPQPKRSSAKQPREVVHAYTAAPAAPVYVQPAPAAEPQSLPPVPFDAAWHHLGKAVHLLIVGETHSGKSTSARAVLAGRILAGDSIAIFDPHATPTTWGGLRAVGAGRDFAAIEQGMLTVLAEMTKRYEQLATDETFQPEPLTIFVDEWPAIQSHCKKVATQFITEMAQEGRKAGMRLVMLTQSDLVSSLGIEGKGDVRSNFLMLLLGAKAIARCPEAASLERPAAFRRGEGNARPVFTNPLQMYSENLNTSAITLWKPLTTKNTQLKPAPKAPDQDPDLDPLWAKFLNGEDLLEPISGTGTEPVGGADFGQKPAVVPVLENAGLADTNGMELVTENQAKIQPNGTSTKPDDELSIAIQALDGAGFSRNKILQFLTIPGNRATQLARIKYALGESEAAA